MSIVAGNLIDLVEGDKEVPFPQQSSHLLQFPVDGGPLPQKKRSEPAVSAPLKDFLHRPHCPGHHQIDRFSLVADPLLESSPDAVHAVVEAQFGDHLFKEADLFSSGIDQGYLEVGTGDGEGKAGVSSTAAQVDNVAKELFAPLCQQRPSGEGIDGMLSRHLFRFDNRGQVHHPVAGSDLPGVMCETSSSVVRGKEVEFLDKPLAELHFPEGVFLGGFVGLLSRLAAIICHFASFQVGERIDPKTR